MKCSRILLAFPWRIALVPALVPGLPMLTFWGWFRWELPPLQQYYLVDYWQSSTAVDQPDAQTQVQWLMETGSGHKARWLLVYDVADGSHDGVPLRLSSTAVGQGWTGIAKSPTESMGSAELEDVLQHDFYDGKSFSQVVSEPVLYSVMQWVLIVYLAFIVRGSMGAEWRELRRVVREPQWPSHDEWNWVGNRQGIVARIRTRIVSRKAEEKQRVESHQFWADFRRRAIHGDAPVPGLSTGSSQPVSTPAQSDVRTLSQPANPLTSSVPKPAPVTHSIFPGSTSPETTQSPPQPWDKSEWID